MITTEQQRRDIIVNNPNKDRVERAQRKNKYLRMHIYGIGLKEHISCIEGFEAPGLDEIRGRYCISNRDLFARLGRPIDKVFSAKGGSIYYNLTENANKMAMRLCMNVRNGLSARKWVEAYWTPHFKDDPDGMLFIETGDSAAYPTYKSSTSYYDYLPAGDTVEYVCFKVTEKEKEASGYRKEDQIYRLVDDAYDYWLKREGDKVTTIEQCTYPNYFGRVPALLNSDYEDPEHDGHKLSIFSDILEVAEYYLLTGSIKITNDFRHGFPKYWEYAGVCERCKGTTTIGGETCRECNGSGRSLMIRFDRVKALQTPESKDQPVIAPHVAGYIEPSKTYHEIATFTKAALEDMMQYTLWNRAERQRTGGTGMTAGSTKTATEIVGELQTTVDKLHPISDSAEKRIKFIIDRKIELELRSGYQGSSVNLGRRYLMETPDELWDRYVRAKTDSADDCLLDELLIDFIETKYGADPVGMEIMLKMLYVVPFFHRTIEQVQSLGVSPRDFAAKLYAGEWQKQIEDSEVIRLTTQELRESLYAYAAEREQPEQPEQPAPQPPATETYQN